MVVVGVMDVKVVVFVLVCGGNVVYVMFVGESDVVDVSFVEDGV